MSLYIGNLLSHTRRDELESVFQRFGRCNVRVKDGYGFVVYDSAPNAEKALIALQGRTICGQPLTLTWSNKQPRGSKRLSRTTRSYEPLCRRSSGSREDYINRNLQSYSQRAYKFGIKPLSGNGGRLKSDDTLDGDTNYHQDNIKDYIQEEHYEYGENLPDEGVKNEPKLVDNDRWAGQLYIQPNGNTEEISKELDQYEHDRKLGGRDGGINHYMAYSDGSHAPQSSQDVLKGARLSEAPLDHPNESAPQITCYSCGSPGHKMCNCPKQSTSGRNFKRLGHRYGYETKRSGRVEGRLERYGSGSVRNLRRYEKSLSINQLWDEGKASGFGRHQMSMKDRSSSKANEADWFIRDRDRKKRRGNFGTLNKVSEKEARRSDSLSVHSDYTESRSHLNFRSSKTVPCSSFHSRSRSVSPTSRSRSSPTPHYPGPTNTKSRSRSNSHKSLSVPESLEKPLPSSLDKVQSNLEATLAKSVISESKEILVEQALPDDVSETAELENTTLVAKSENVTSSSKLENVMDKFRPMQLDWDDNLMLSMSSHDKPNQSAQPSEKCLLTAGSFSSEILKETTGHQNADASMTKHKLASIKTSNSESSFRLQPACSTSISSDEMCIVLKHYGLELDDKNERILPPEAYFGSARLWPWEIVYYRKLKKGPISTENYARRLAQNQEFGIVDKYVRSSSGWGELDQECS